MLESADVTDHLGNFQVRAASIIRAVIGGSWDQLGGLCYLGVITAAYICSVATGDRGILEEWWPALGPGEALEFLEDGGWPVSTLRLFMRRWSHAMVDLPTPPSYDAYAQRPADAAPDVAPDVPRPVPAPLLLSILGHHATFVATAALAVASAWAGEVSLVCHSCQYASGEDHYYYYYYYYYY